MYLSSNITGLMNFHVDVPGCKESDFFRIWAKSGNGHNRSDELDLNDIYWKPSYHYQTHEVTVDEMDDSILEALLLGERMNFTVTTL